ncbi:MAG: sensor histidine kinase [Acidobacteriota bacterium]
MLQRLELQKQQLVAFLVHDLKGPVNAIDLYAQVIARGTPDDHARARMSAERIREETRTLLRMITDLLDISKADEGRLAPSPADVDASSLVHDVLDMLAVAAARSSVTLATEIEVATIHCDRDLIARVLSNLVDNAIRHAPDGSEVRVVIAEVDGHTEIRVADGGPGIPREQHASVFERFVSGGLTTRANRGLGLAFCNLAVEAHGGRIWIEDGTPGAVFCVRI